MVTPVEPPHAVVVLVTDRQEISLGCIGGRARCDLDLVQRLLRLRLAAGRYGWTLRLTDVQDDLRRLVELVGVSDRLGL